MIDARFRDRARQHHENAPVFFHGHGDFRVHKVPARVCHLDAFLKFRGAEAGGADRAYQRKRDGTFLGHDPFESGRLVGGL